MENSFRLNFLRGVAEWIGDVSIKHEILCLDKLKINGLCFVQGRNSQNNNSRTG